MTHLSCDAVDDGVDGKIDDWAMVPESYAVGTNELMDTEQGHGMNHDTKNLDVKVRVGWVKGLNRLYFLYEGFDNYWDFAASLVTTGAIDGDAFRAAPLEECLPEFRAFAGDRISAGIRADLERFRVSFDVWFNESTLYRDGRMEQTLEELKALGAAYDKDGATWLRTTDYGDTEDRVLVKSTGLPTYLLPDLAYHRDKHERGFDEAIDVWGADHHSYAVRMQAGLEALGYPRGWLRPVIYQQISLIEDGQEVRLSTRKNRMVTLGELLDDGQSGLVVVAATDMEAHVERAVKKADKTTKKELRADEKAIEAEIDEASKA